MGTVNTMQHLKNEKTGFIQEFCPNPARHIPVGTEKTAQR